MSYFPDDIPFMSNNELKENGICTPKDVPDINVGDTISRQDAIDAVIKADYEDSGVLSERRCKKFETALKALPPAEPQRKTGRWISLDDFRGKYNEYGYKCSECGEHCDYKESYCPGCGAKMEVEHE